MLSSLVPSLRSSSPTPIQRIGVHLCALHAYADDISRQIIAHHYCSHVSEEMHQCVIYDSNKKDAKLIGIEYLISKRLFATLDKEEKALWHSHNYEVKSGMLVSPELPGPAERLLLNQIINMYGKTIHTWRIDRDALPIGSPALMVALTNDNQPINHQLIQEIDKLAGSNIDERKSQRKDIMEEKKVEDADRLEKGEKINFIMVKNDK